MLHTTRNVFAFSIMALGSPISYAALYQVIAVESPTESTYAYGVAIEQEQGSVDCFQTQCLDEDYELAGDTLNATDGFSLKEEVPFSYDNQFYILDYDDLYDYCDQEYGYETCSAWTDRHWYGDTDLGIGGLENTRNAYYEATYQTNSTAFFSFHTLLADPEPGSNAPSTDDYSYFFNDGTHDKVITAIDENGFVIGNTSSRYYSYDNQYVQLYSHRGYYYEAGSLVVLEPKADTSLTFADSEGEQNIISQMGRSMAFDSFTFDGKTYMVGSASVATFYYDDSSKDYDSGYTSDSDEEDVSNCVDYDAPALHPECQNFAFANRAFVWNISDSEGPNSDGNQFAAAPWKTDTSGTYHEYNDDLASAQASVRGASISNSGSYAYLPVLVGYNTYIDDSDNFLMQAAIFRPTVTDGFAVSENAWSTTFITNATVEVSDEYIHSHSMANDINSNMLVIGHAKRDSDYPQDGVTDDRMFVANANDSSPSASFFTAMSESIFFDSAEGRAQSVNNYNEIVGYVDAEEHREVEGKIRRHRGYIFPYNFDNTDAKRRARFSNQAWWLDDLTNGGDYSAANNHFRIIDASDINDAGVISATAVQCFASEDATTSIEYDSTDHFAYCGDNAGYEKVIAVKLLPIAGTTGDDIVVREEDTSTTERQGASLGWLVLLLLSILLLSHRRVYID